MVDGRAGARAPRRAEVECKRERARIRHPRTVVRIVLVRVSSLATRKRVPSTVDGVLGDRAPRRAEVERKRERARIRPRKTAVTTVSEVCRNLATRKRAHRRRHQRRLPHLSMVVGQVGDRVLLRVEVARNGGRVRIQHRNTAVTTVSEVHRNLATLKRVLSTADGRVGHLAVRHVAEGFDIERARILPRNTTAMTASGAIGSLATHKAARLGR